MWYFLPSSFIRKFLILKTASWGLVYLQDVIFNMSSFPFNSFDSILAPSPLGAPFSSISLIPSRIPSTPVSGALVRTNVQYKMNFISNTPVVYPLYRLFLLYFYWHLPPA